MGFRVCRLGVEDLESMGLGFPFFWGVGLPLFRGLGLGFRI